MFKDIKEIDVKRYRGGQNSYLTRGLTGVSLEMYRIFQDALFLSPLLFIYLI